MNSFEQILTNHDPDPTVWCHHHSTTEFIAYLDALEEAFDLSNGAALLAGTRVSFRRDLIVDDLGECHGPQGSICHALSFRLGVALTVIACLENDGVLGRLAYRGSCDAFQRIAAELRLSRGRSFAHLRVGQAAALPLSNLAQRSSSPPPARRSR